MFDAGQNGVKFDVAFSEPHADRAEQSRARQRRIIVTVSMANGLGRERIHRRPFLHEIQRSHLNKFLLILVYGIRT